MCRLFCGFCFFACPRFNIVHDGYMLYNKRTLSTIHFEQRLLWLKRRLNLMVDWQRRCMSVVSSCLVYMYFFKNNNNTSATTRFNSAFVLSAGCAAVSYARRSCFFVCFGAKIKFWCWLGFALYSLFMVILMAMVSFLVSFVFGVG